MSQICAYLATSVSEVPTSVKILLLVLFLAIVGFYLWLLWALHRETSRYRLPHLGVRPKRMWRRRLY